MVFFSLNICQKKNFAPFTKSWIHHWKVKTLIQIFGSCKPCGGRSVLCPHSVKMNLIKVLKRKNHLTTCCTNFLPQVCCYLAFIYICEIFFQIRLFKPTNLIEIQCQMMFYMWCTMYLYVIYVHLAYRTFMCAF